MRIKLLSAWFGVKPLWYSTFVAQMSRFTTIDWVCLPPPEVRIRDQIGWMNQQVKNVVGFPCKKDSVFGTCDYRPAYGDVFKKEYAGYDYIGWCDLDILFGDLDSILPPLLADTDVLTFKQMYLSGCFTILRNIPEVTQLYKQTDTYRKVFRDWNYHFWDESGHPKFAPEASFFQMIVTNNKRIRITHAPHLYVCDTLQVPSPVSLRNGKLFDSYENEIALIHFMSDVWPVRGDGTSRWSTKEEGSI